MDTLTLEITIRLKPTLSIAGVESALSVAGASSKRISIGDSSALPAVKSVALTEERAALARKASIGDPNTEDHPSGRYRHHYQSPNNRKAWTGEWAQRRALAERGIIPPIPDYTAPTHDAYREKIDIIKQLVDEGDVETLKAITIVERSSTPVSLAKYRDLAIHALTIQREAKRSID
jgi:hypothetical protein